MINRWQGNSGRVQRLPESADRRGPSQAPGRTAPQRPQEQRQPAPPLEREQNTAPARRAAPPMSGQSRKPGGLLSGLEGLTKLLPGKMEALETEDIILLLILYLMYRESGDSELLMIMGAMFLL